ncbi:carbohydrate ABC transporter permease [Aquibacillus koreensis]|uniref:Carbohydrate ABC transporter permease n=1 Tax=Aquibacillus koreensis TaxID=279446 RepID=A0A9X4AHB4_9BACI|nr:carbohydrate ABC transporter permease [Aquibacillus koreensis]MCT2537070.1 carbohydrate ABC transporter permease [Aquibacillus koreensis]MDC3419947.1 carbohydrate ABC transporter permease [Aquibacillus koreensis]
MENQVKIDPNITISQNKKKKPLSVGRVVLYIFMAFVGLLQLFPLLWLFDYSLLNSGQFFGDKIFQVPSPPQWENYVSAFTQGNVLPYFFNSVLVTFVSVALTAITSILLAYAFTRMKWKLSALFMNIILLGMMIPIHATLLPNFIIFNEVGFLNSYWALILPYTAFNIPVSMFIVTGFMQTIPRSIEEAAVIDGASIWRILFSIIFPITKPAIATISVVNFINCWNEFIMAYTFITMDKFKTLPFSIIQFVGQYSSNYGAQFAVMALIAIPSIIMYLIFTDEINKGLMAGSVKG